MEEKNKSHEILAAVISQLTNLCVLLLFVIAALIAYIIYIPKARPVVKKKTEQKAPVIAETPIAYWSAPDLALLEQNTNKEKILYGRDIIMHTSSYFGEHGTIRKASTNGMNCQNCHLDGGTKVFGNNYSAVASTYPKYRPRSGTIENIFKRINDCFERSLNGQALDTNSIEMQSIADYILWLGKDVPKGEKPAGSGFKDITFLERQQIQKRAKQFTAKNA